MTGMNRSGATLLARSSAAPEPAPPGPRRSRRRRLVLVGLGVALTAIGVLVAGWAVVAGVERPAGAARANLEQFRTELRAGDVAAATRSLHRARAELLDARAALAGQPWRGAAVLPPVRRIRTDVAHLVAAGVTLTGAGDQAVSAYSALAGPDAHVVHDGALDLSALPRVTGLLADLGPEVAAARADLVAVRGSGWEYGVAGARDGALRQVADLERQRAAATALLGVLPDALGARGTRHYLVTILNYGELRPSGGAPLSIALVALDHGRFRIVQRGQTSVLTHLNERVRWQPLPQDPWQRGSQTQRFVDANYSPDFPTSGAELCRLYAAEFGVRPDGVLALDPSALAALLAASGPVDVPGYGVVRGENLVDKTLVDAYRAHQDVAERHHLNDTLMDAVLGRLLGGRLRLSTLRALSTAAAGGHVQAEFGDPSVEALALDHGLGHPLLPAAGDALAVYTSNSNASKVDLFQRRTVTQTVQLHRNGAATVVRTVVLRNDVPPAVNAGVDDRFGYLTRWSEPQISEYLPARAQLQSLTLDGRPSGSRTMFERDRKIISFAAELAPGASATARLQYRLPPTRFGGRLGYALRVDPQPMRLPTNLTVTVQPPPGYAVASPHGWTRTGDTLTLTGQFTSAQVTSAAFVPRHPLRPLTGWLVGCLLVALLGWRRLVPRNPWSQP